MPVDHTALKVSNIGTAAVASITSGKNLGGDDLSLPIRGESTLTLSSASGAVEFLEDAKVAGSLVTSTVQADPDNDTEYTKAISWNRNTEGPSSGGDGGSYWVFEGGQLGIRRKIPASVALDPFSGTATNTEVTCTFSWRINDSQGLELVKFEGTSASAVPIGSTAPIINSFDVNYNEDEFPIHFYHYGGFFRPFTMTIPNTDTQLKGAIQSDAFAVSMWFKGSPHNQYDLFNPSDTATFFSVAHTLDADYLRVEQSGTLRVLWAGTVLDTGVEVTGWYWHHLAVRVNNQSSTSNVEVYVDGVSVATLSQDTSARSGWGDSTWHFGRREITSGDGAFYLNVPFDEVAIWHGAAVPPAATIASSAFNGGSGAIISTVLPTDLEAWFPFRAINLGTTSVTSLSTNAHSATLSSADGWVKDVTATKTPEVNLLLDNRTTTSSFAGDADFPQGILDDNMSISAWFRLYDSPSAALASPGLFTAASATGGSDFGQIFGYSSDGLTAAVSMALASVTIWEKSGGVWAEQASFTPASAETIYEIDVSEDGSTIMVFTLDTVREAEVFERSGASWSSTPTPVGVRTIADIGAWAVMDETGTVIASNEEVTNPSSGKINVYVRPGASWGVGGPTPLAKTRQLAQYSGFTNFDTKRRCYISGDGSTIIYTQRGNVNEQGRITLWERPESGWGTGVEADLAFTAKMAPAVAAHFMAMGMDVDLSYDGGVFVAGVPNRDANRETEAGNSGGAYVFQRQGATWSVGDVWTYENARLRPAYGHETNAGFGSSVSVSHDGLTIAVASKNFEGSTNAADGFTYLYKRPITNGWDSELFQNATYSVGNGLAGSTNYNPVMLRGDGLAFFGTELDGSLLGTASGYAYEYELSADPVSGVMTLVGNTQATGTSSGRFLTVDASTGVVSFSTGGVSVSTDAGYRGDSGWHHVIVTKAGDGTTAGDINLYIDGALVAQTPNLSGAAVSPSLAGLFVGKSVENTTDSDWYTGHAKHVAVFDAVLSTLQIGELYNGGALDQVDVLASTANANVQGWWKLSGDATDRSGNGRDMVLAGVNSEYRQY